ncbi:MAG: DUF4162 domain-containing protein, partial [Lachnospiraceae bacterium]|nr:DUF4162 domain-containing protein [Lachnospiraceae bacterium]
IACGIAHKPKLIFMDEPTVAVDPQSRQKILDGILELNKNGSTIIYTTHYMEEVEQICDRILIMDNGRGIAAGTKNELKSMISTGETVTIDIPHMDEHEIYGIKDLPNVIDATYRNESLTVKCTNGKHNLMSLLEYLNDNEIPFGKVYSELPTLNDVFLEITGKHLMDNSEPEEIAPKKKKHKRI